jgi:hypothetical protein
MAEQIAFPIAVIDPEAHRILLAQRPRKCLCCQRDFESAGVGNRICGRCRSSEAFTCSPAEYSIAASF